MKQQKKLFKLALAALVMTAGSSVELLEAHQTQDVFHANGACSGHKGGNGGCGAASPDTTNNMNDRDYNWNQNTPTTPNSNQRWNQGNSNAPTTYTNTEKNPVSYNEYNQESNTQKMNQGAAKTRYETNMMQGDYRARTNYYNNTNAEEQRYLDQQQQQQQYVPNNMNDAAYRNDAMNRNHMVSGQTMPSVSEADFKSKLDERAARAYNSMNAEGRTLAIQLASQKNFTDNNGAVMEAAQRYNVSGNAQR